MPIVLDMTEAKRLEIEGAGKICLKDMQGFSLAMLNVEEIWQPNKEKKHRPFMGPYTISQK
ncbi:MAG: hypothetical protein LW832_07305 [Parachlamydia sp.]|nr:hypothetical protein [Parachlamydia sp.]